MPAPSPIFVAGTGRSGTSRLADIIGEHPGIHRIPMETRFIVDPGGLRDLADALTIRYDPIVGEDALRRITDLLTVRIPGRRDDRGKTVPELVGEQRYRDTVDALWPRLIACEYSAPRNGRRMIPKYFGDRRELLDILARTVDALFGGAAADAGKPVWCEKTPFNLLCMDFLWELFPAATIVHIKRHPLAVVASHVDQSWAPPTAEGALAWVKPVYDRWLSWKSTADLATRRYVEVKAEDLAADWPAQRRALFERLGVDDFATTATFRHDLLHHRDDQFDPETRKRVERALDGVIPAMGYR